ncbi:MAG: aminoglycoside phosphotransferase family protein [Chthoniobacter sp.]|nr:aminoglycoside phosphotransferase family protein [Chthoniobacter sp.]
MRGEALDLESIIPKEELHRELQDLLRQYFAQNVHIERLDRRISEYCSSFIIEELDVTLDDGSTHKLILKDLSQAALMEGAGRVKPWFFYDPMREIETYRRVLVLHQLGTAICYGAVTDPQRKRHWLFLERVPPVMLWQQGDLEIWKNVARWLAGMHTFLVRETDQRESARLAHLLNYDRDFYWRWMRRAANFVCEGDKSSDRKAATAIRNLESRYEKVVERLAALPVTVIHGEFYASNVMIDTRLERLRVCPVDWEMAAIGPGKIDLAGLTSGGWTREQKDAMALAYYDALPADRLARYDRQTFLTDLEYCRLHQAVQWLGWSPCWSPPPEHAHDWLKEAVNCAETLAL